MEDERLLLSRRETAQRLSVSVRMVDYAIAGGKLKTRRIGRRVLIPVAEVERFAQRDHPSVAPAPKDGRG